jgi:hypothetical protein
LPFHVIVAGRQSDQLPEGQDLGRFKLDPALQQRGFEFGLQARVSYEFSRDRHQDGWLGHGSPPASGRASLRPPEPLTTSSILRRFHEL